MSYGFYDLFGEGKVSKETTVVVKVLVNQKLLEDGAVSIKKVDETVTKAIEDASNNYKEDLSSVSADLSSTNEDLSKTKESLNTVASDLSTKSKELSDEITGVKQDITGLTSTVNNNAGNISQLQQRATDIETTVADNNKKLSSQITQNADSISSVVANLNNTNLANSPYKSITQLNQTANSISSIVSANKSAQDSVNSSLTSKINQNADSITSVVANLNNTDLANSPYKSITQLKQATDSISSTVSANKSAQDSVNSSLTSKIQQNAGSISSVVANLNNTNLANNPYKSITQLKQTTDSISSTVSSNKSAQDSVNSSLTSKIQQNANSVTSIIANLSDVDKAKKNYSAISQMQDDINLRVAKGNVISQINLDKTGATIDGKLLHVTGDTVIEKNVIAKGMIQAGAVTTDNLAAETINLTDKLKIQGGNVTLDENGLAINSSDGKTIFNGNGMVFTDSTGTSYNIVTRSIMGTAKNGQYVKFGSKWPNVPNVIVSPLSMVVSNSAFSQSVITLHSYADQVTEEGFYVRCYSGIQSGQGVLSYNRTYYNGEFQVWYNNVDVIKNPVGSTSFTAPSNGNRMTVRYRINARGVNYMGATSVRIRTKIYKNGSPVHSSVDESELINGMMSISTEFTQIFNFSPNDAIKVESTYDSLGEAKDGRGRIYISCDLVSATVNVTNEQVLDANGTALFLVTDGASQNYTVS